MKTVMEKYFVRFIDADGDEDGGEIEARSLDDAICMYQRLLRERGVDWGKNKQFRAEPVTPVRCWIAKDEER